MPPRVVKKSGASSGAAKKTVARGAKGKAAAAAAQTEKIAQEEAAVKAAVKAAEVTPPEQEIQPKVNGSVENEVTKEDTKEDTKEHTKEDIKEVYVEEDKGERLDLDDTELEYDPEEEPVEDNEKDTKNEDESAEGDAGDGGEDEYDHGDGIDEGEEGDEGDMVEEIESDGGEAEGDKDNEEEAEEAPVDAAEHEEQHDVLTEHRKRKEFEVFVGGLDKDVTEDELKKFFSEVGQVVEVRLMKNPVTKKNKGFAFLRFSTVEQAKRAVAEMKSPVIKGKQCGVSPCQDNDTLFLGNICKTWTKEHLMSKLKQYGVDKIEDLTLVEDSNNEGLNRGFAFLEFPSRKDATEAYRLLRKRDVAFGVDRPAKVSFADPFIEPDDEIMAQVKTVFIDGLPVSWDEERLRDHLKKFGQIEKVELARNMPSARRRDFGFVSFDTHESAVKCAESINNTEIGEGDKKVKVRARLSRPLQKGRGKFGRRTENLKSERTPSRGSRFSYGRSQSYRELGQSKRPIGSRVPAGPRGTRRPLDLKPRRPTMDRIRDLPPPGRSYERRPPVDPYPKSSSKRDIIRRELPPRSRAPVDYPSRDPDERRSFYRDEYMHGPSYADEPPRSARTAVRRNYDDEAYGRRIERPISMYREGHSRDYDSIAGSKRPYAAIDDVPPRYADISARPTRPRYDYGAGAGSDYSSYGERISRSSGGYGSGRSSFSAQESQPGYSSSRYTSARGSDVRGMHSSSYNDSSYVPRSQIGGSSSYSSLYSSRGMGGSGYLGGSGSGSYY